MSLQERTCSCTGSSLIPVPLTGAHLESQPALHGHSSSATLPWLLSRCSQAQHSEVISTTVTRECQQLPLINTRLQSDSELSPQQAQELPINSSTALTSIDFTQHIPVKPVTILNAWSLTAGTQKDSWGLLHTQAKLTKGLTPHFPWAGRCSAKARTARHGNRTIVTTPNIPHFLLLLWLYIMVWDVPGISCAHVSPLWPPPPPNSLCTPLAGGVRSRAALAVPGLLSN